MPLADLTQSIAKCTTLKDEEKKKLEDLVEDLDHLRDATEKRQKTRGVASKEEEEEEGRNIPDFSAIQILPTHEELTADCVIDPNVPVNIIDRPLRAEDGLLYLNTHYRLLREDYVAVSIFKL
jgi:hypothetical protein